VQGFDLVHHWVVTRAWLQDGPPRDFVIDSSAGWTVITPATAEALGLTVTDSDPDLAPRGQGEDAPPVRFARLPLLRVAGLTLRDQTVLVMDLDALAEACTAAGHEVAGVLGYNVLRSTRLILDYRRRIVRLEPGEA
jgi:hypothetical protein